MQPVSVLLQCPHILPFHGPRWPSQGSTWQYLLVHSNRLPNLEGVSNDEHGHVLL